MTPPRTAPALANRLRARAEKLLAKTSREVAQMPVADVQKLVHELQVHQIELEMQNEELRRTQLELETARERLLLPYDAAPVGFLTLDAKAAICEANLAAARLLNVDRVQLTGRKLTRFIAPESQETFYLRQRQLFATAEKQTCELLLLPTGGAPFIARLEMVVEHTASEPPTCCLVVLSDISAHIRAEEALRHSEARLAAFARATFEGIIESEAGRILDCNEQFARMMGCSVAELKGLDMAALIAPEDRDRVLAGIHAGREQAIEHAMLRLDGGPRLIVEGHGQPVSPGSLRRHTAIRDITLRKQAEAALQQARAELEQRVQERTKELNQANAALRAFFHQAPIGLVWLSASGTILRANQAQLDLMGCPAADYEGRSFPEFCVEPAQGRELLERLAAKETVRNLRLTQRGKDNVERHLLVDAISLWSGSQFEYSSVFLRDITDRLQLEQEILHISEQEHQRIAQDLHDGLGQLLVGAAYLAGTVRQDLAAKSRPEARQLRRIWEVINEALALTRNLARGLHPVAAEPNGLMVALAALAARTGTLFQIRCQFRCRRPVLIHDNSVATHLFRIAQEAVTNAIKHGKSERIQIRLTETPNRLNLAIQDDGSGTPVRRRKLGGMGLRIMHYRAGMIGGSLAIQKPARGGTSIVCTVKLPAPSVWKRHRRTVRMQSLRKY